MGIKIGVEHMFTRGRVSGLFSNDSPITKTIFSLQRYGRAIRVESILKQRLPKKMKNTKELLNVRNLRVRFNAKEGAISIVDGIDLRVNKGEAVGLVGETGAGKTVTARSILRILQPIGKGKPLWTIEGEIFFKGKDLFTLSEEETRAIRGTEISYIPQNPIPSLHPIDVIGYQTGEAVEEHEELERQRIWEMVVEHLGKVEIADAKQRYNDFRDQFSGGEGQRILIAMALIRNPSLLIADEPTSSLDVTVQRQILQLLKAVKKQFNLSMLLIAHNLAVIAELSDYVYVMYAGKIVEHGNVVTIFSNAVHPYTRGLMASIPRMHAKKGDFSFGGIPGEPPNPLYPISGCKFHPRCNYAMPACSTEEPESVEIEPNHSVGCLRVDDLLKS